MEHEKESKTLASNSLNLTDSIVMGIAGTAPAYSIEITTSTFFSIKERGAF